MTKFNNIDKMILAFVFVVGGLILFIPLQKLLILLVALVIFAFLFLNPKYCFYLMLVLSTYIQAFATEAQQMPFNQTDVLITICFVGVLWKMFSKNQKVNLSTKLDKWFVVLFILYFVDGFTSISHRGYQSFLQYGEALAVFYLTVHFIRTKEIKLSELIKVILFVGIFQALYGILQSVTGSFGANFQDNRGYLGYLGIGSTLVWHGRGTFEHFNTLGPFLSTMFLFYLPINYFVVENKKKGYTILSILFFGVVMTYSRGSLLALLAGVIFFLYQISKDKKKFLLKTSPIALILGVLSLVLKNTSYVSTISPRSDMWNLAFNAVLSSPKSLFFGSGFKSYTDAVWSYIGANIPVAFYNDYYAHNFFIAYLVEIGLVGLAIIVAFLLNILIMTYRDFKAGIKSTKHLNMAIYLIVLSIFFEGMFDHAFTQFIFQVWLYLFFGILCAKSIDKSEVRDA